MAYPYIRTILACTVILTGCYHLDLPADLENSAQADDNVILNGTDTAGLDSSVSVVEDTSTALGIGTDSGGDIYTSRSTPSVAERVDEICTIMCESNDACYGDLYYLEVGQPYDVGTCHDDCVIDGQNVEQDLDPCVGEGLVLYKCLYTGLVDTCDPNQAELQCIAQFDAYDACVFNAQMAGAHGGGQVGSDGQMMVHATLAR